MVLVHRMKKFKATKSKNKEVPKNANKSSSIQITMALVFPTQRSIPRGSVLLFLSCVFCCILLMRSLAAEDDLEKLMLELSGAWKTDLTAITATWWDDSLNCNTTVEGIKPFRRGRQGGRAEGAALCVKDYEELPLRNRNR